VSRLLFLESVSDLLRSKLNDRRKSSHSVIQISFVPDDEVRLTPCPVLLVVRFIFVQRRHSGIRLVSPQAFLGLARSYALVSPKISSDCGCPQTVRRTAARTYPCLPFYHLLIIYIRQHSFKPWVKPSIRSRSLQPHEYSSEFVRAVHR